MPRTSTIWLDNAEWEKLENRFEAEGYPSHYAYIKDLILNDIKKVSKIKKSEKKFRRD